jgi:hypothetical protein
MPIDTHLDREHNWGHVNVASFGARGIEDDSQALRDAITAAGGQESIVISVRTRIRSAIGTIATPLIFRGAGMLEMQAGGSITLAGAITAPLTQIFDVSGGGTITFAAKTEYVTPHWWGAKGDGVTDDTAAFQAAMAAYKYVRVPDATYSLTNITIPASVVLQGSGQDTILRFDTAGDGITINTFGVSATPQVVQGFAFSHGAATPANYIHITGGEDVALRDLYFVDTGATAGIRNTFGYGTRIEHVVFHFFTGTPIYLEQTPGDATFSYAISLNVDITNNTGTGIIVEGGSFTLTPGSIVESCSGGGIRLATNATVLPGKIDGAYLESNTGFDIYMDSDGGTGTRWAELSISGSRFTVPAGIQMNGHGVLHMEGVRGVSGTLNVTQLQGAYDPTQAEVIATSCKGVSLDANFGATTINGASVSTRYTSAAGTFSAYDSNTGAVLRGNVNDGAGAVGVKLANASALATAGAKALEVYRDAQTTPVMAVRKNANTWGVRLQSPDGTWYLLTIANGGAVNIAADP